MKTVIDVIKVLIAGARWGTLSDADIDDICDAPFLRVMNASVIRNTKYSRISNTVV
jgi:hypothetical protein